jgi:hypothetical protein
MQADAYLVKRLTIGEITAMPESHKCSRDRHIARVDERQ